MCLRGVRGAQHSIDILCPAKYVPDLRTTNTRQDRRAGTSHRVVLGYDAALALNVGLKATVGLHELYLFLRGLSEPRMHAGLIRSEPPSRILLCTRSVEARHPSICGAVC